ncbi:MAG: tetratricopeptide repeat protein [Candidatus Obscuribacterales bacterium]|nr:tetratricopeptide repeat protein [Candidatus Obscuribacterales bacterium]
MNLTFNTKNVNIAVALRALDLYRAGKFKEAVGALLEVLDAEPQNWDARLMLGACYYRTGQYFSAQNAFRMVADQAQDAQLRNRARQGLLATSSKTGGRVETAPEFGSCAVRQEFVVAWLEA